MQAKWKEPVSREYTLHVKSQSPESPYYTVPLGRQIHGGGKGLVDVYGGKQGESEVMAAEEWWCRGSLKGLNTLRLTKPYT